MPDDINQANQPVQLIDRTLIKPIELDDSQGRWIFEPKADITALEAVLISQMWAAITVRYLKGDQSRFDWREYLTRDHSQPAADPIYLCRVDLARHFRSME